MSSNKAIIYGLKNGEDLRYVGKTNSGKSNDEGEIRKSRLSQLYINTKTKEIVSHNDGAHVVPLLEVPVEEWYDEKLREVVKQYQEGNDLVNADWMKRGKRGYWQDKKRDSHTLQALSQSKYKTVEQFDLQGNYVQTWRSAKDVAIHVFGEYEIKNGSASSGFYQVISSANPRGHRYGKYYWWTTEELLTSYGRIPESLNIELMQTIYDEGKKRNRKTARRTTRKTQTHTTRYTVVLTQADGSERVFDNVRHCAHVLGMTESTVKNIVSGHKKHKYDLRYGKKLRQPVNPCYD